jgi:hypothetical protein
VLDQHRISTTLPEGSVVYRSANDLELDDALLSAPDMEWKGLSVIMRETSRFAACLCGAGLLLILVAAPFDTANAAEPYVEVGVSRTELETRGFIQDISTVARGEFNKEHSVGWRIAGGYRVWRYVGFEAGFVDFGKPTVENELLSFSNTSTTRLDEGRVRIKGPFAAVTGSLSAGQWQPFAKIGVLRADTSVSAHVVFNNLFTGQRLSEYFVSDSATSTELLLGLGVTFRAMDHYGVSFELTRVPNAGDEERTGEDDVTSYSLSFQYSF